MFVHRRRFLSRTPLAPSRFGGILTNPDSVSGRREGLGATPLRSYDLQPRNPRLCSYLFSCSGSLPARAERRALIPAGRPVRLDGNTSTPVLVDYLQDPARPPHYPHPTAIAQRSASGRYSACAGAMVRRPLKESTISRAGRVITNMAHPAYFDPDPGASRGPQSTSGSRWSPQTKPRATTRPRPRSRPTTPPTAVHTANVPHPTSASATHVPVRSVGFEAQCRGAGALTSAQFRSDLAAQRSLAFAVLT